MGRQEFNGRGRTRPVMDDAADRQKAIDCLFDDANSGIIAELEGGPRPLSELSAKSGLSEGQILSRLSCLIDAKVLSKTSSEGGPVCLSADGQRLTELIESDGNFDAAIDGLTKIDGYLN